MQKIESMNQQREGYRQSGKKSNHFIGSSGSRNQRFWGSCTGRREGICIGTGTAFR